MEETAAVKDRLLLEDPCYAADELQEVGLRLVQVPVEPGQFVVLAIGVVVALLGAADFVAGQDHRHALGKQQRGQEVPHLLAPQARIAGSSVGPSTPQFQLVLLFVAVAVVFAVGLVVLVVVGNQVVEREAVVAGDEVDAGVGPAAAPCRGRWSRSDGWRTRRPAAVALQKRRIASRYLPFHSDHEAGKLPTW